MPLQDELGMFPPGLIPSDKGHTDYPHRQENDNPDKSSDNQTEEAFPEYEGGVNPCDHRGKSHREY